MLTDDRPPPLPATPDSKDDTRPPDLPPLHKGNAGYVRPPARVMSDEERTWHLEQREVPCIEEIARIAPGPFFSGSEVEMRPEESTNPKTLMGRTKLPILSVIPITALLREAEAMAYGAFEAPRADGGKGYGPFNWREKAVEYMTYIDANQRHVALAVDGEDIDPKTMCLHLAHARASLGILIDAIEKGMVIDDRPRQANRPTYPGQPCDAARILDAHQQRKVSK